MSSEEARLLLKKWADEGREVLADIRLPALKISMVGILHFDNTLMIAAKAKQTYMLIELEGANYVYVEARDAPQPAREHLEAAYDGSVRIRLPDKTIQIFASHGTAEK